MTKEINSNSFHPSSNFEKQTLFERLSSIPCYRTSLLSGISAGIFIGLFSFIRNSNPKRSTNIGFGSYVAITLTTWIYCRTNLTKEKIEGKKFKSAFQKYYMREGVNNNNNNNNKHNNNNNHNNNIVELKEA